MQSTPVPRGLEAISLPPWAWRKARASVREVTTLVDGLDWTTTPHIVEGTRGLAYLQGVIFGPKYTHKELARLRARWGAGI